MSRICFYYEETRDTGGKKITKIQCFCGTTACRKLPSIKPKEICQCCCEVNCDYSTTGCPWYVDATQLNYLLSQVQAEKEKL